MAPGTRMTGYGDHPTDVPFLEVCDRGVLVEELGESSRGSCEFEPASALEASKLEALIGGA
jgi:predicted mannosyl-3-phosphoglycerate phosphatase (HAD superfamily)